MFERPWHNFTWTLFNTNAINSIMFVSCDNAIINLLKKPGTVRKLIYSAKATSRISLMDTTLTPQNLMARHRRTKHIFHYIFIMMTQSLN